MIPLTRPYVNPYALHARHRAPYSARREHETAWVAQFAPRHRKDDEQVSTGR